MKLTAQIEENEVEIDIKKDGSRVFASIDGRQYEIESSQPEANVYLLKYDNKIYEAFVSPYSQDKGLSRVKVGSQDFEITLTDPKRLRGSGADAAKNDGMAELKTAMPGKVVRILLNEGDETKQGDGIIVVEAMKMQNEMKSPKDGVVKEIRFAEGDSVDAGDILAVIE